MTRKGNDDMKSLEDFTKGIAGKVIQGSLKTLSLYSSACSYKVPEDLRKLKESAYTPRVIAIGPLHREDKHLQTPMKDVKLYYTEFLFSRLDAEGLNAFEVLKECVERMKERVYEAKKHYAVEVTEDDDAMSNMMLIDGCFILELLYSHCIKSQASNSIPQPNGVEGSSKSSNGSQEQKIVDPILDNILMASNVKHDLLLLENQIPFFVLEDLFELTVGRISGCPHKSSLTDHVISYFGNIMSPEEDENSGSKKKTCFSPGDCVLRVCGSTNETEQGKTESDFIDITSSENENSGIRNKTCGSTKESEKQLGEASQYYHLLHLLHSYYLPNDSKKIKEQKFSCTPPCASPWCFLSALPWCTPPSEKTTKNNSASDLDFAGVKFVSLKGKNLFKVNFKEPGWTHWLFHRARFEIPTLHIHNPTEPFLRNVIALEQCCQGVPPYFTSYAKLMDMLIDSEKDVRVLKKAKVIHHYLGKDEDVSELFNKLCKKIVTGEDEDFYFKDACDKASKYSDHRWPQSLAYLRRTYFASPWAFIGFCLAIIAFLIQIASFVLDLLDVHIRQ